MTDRLSWPLAVLAIALGLSGCSTINSVVGIKKPPPCPYAATLNNADRLVRFNGAGRDLTDVVFDAKITRINGDCGVTDTMVNVTMTIDFVAQRGQALTGNQAQFSYLVAILDPTGQVIARQVFPTAITFADKPRAGITEELDQQIPLAPGYRAQDYQIYVGFELTKDELDYNRNLVH
jgi:hypothetical protein